MRERKRESGRSGGPVSVIVKKLACAYIGEGFHGTFAEGGSFVRGSFVTPYPH